MKTNILYTWILASMLFMGILPLEVRSQNLSDTVKQIDLLFEGLNQNTPGAALRVSRGDKVLYSKGFGMSDLEHNAPITDETIFEAGSVSKQFVATSILILVQEGKVNLDDDIRQYIPEFPKYDHKITVRHLLNHTSGVRDWGVVARLGGWPRGTCVYTNDAALAYILKQEGLNNIPGDEYLYSNSNYTLLTFIVERVSGEKLPEFTKKRIFEPLGMEDSKWRTNFKKIVKNRAIGYDKINGEILSNMPFENTYGHAALLTNVKDLDIWNKSWKKSPLGDENLINLRTEQGILNNGEKISYAAGVMIGSHNQHPEVYHSGATAGYRCWLSYYPVDNLSIVYLSNATYLSTTKMGREVADIFFGEEPVVTKSKKVRSKTTYTASRGELRDLIGKYYSKECGGEYIIKIEDDSLWIYDHANKKRFLKPISKNSFKSDENTNYVFKTYGTNRQMYISVIRARNVKFERK